MYFEFILKTDNINVDSTKQINDCKNNTLKVERIQNTFENLNSFEIMLKMLKTMQIYEECIFWVFVVFSIFLFFFKTWGQKLGSNNDNHLQHDYSHPSKSSIFLQILGKIHTLI